MGSVKANRNAIERLTFDNAGTQARFKIGKLCPGIKRAIGNEGVEIGFFAAVANR